MQFLVVSRPTERDRREALRDVEEDALGDMRSDGFLQQIWRRDDGAGSYSLVEAPTLDEASKRLATLPFVVQGAITIEIIPVTARFLDGTKS
jgi:muconolactone delta-isomerase